jgi:hypothetical protein
MFPRPTPGPAPLPAIVLLAALLLVPSAHAGLTGAWSREGNIPEGVYGSSVSTAGDVNGDGYSDVIIGANGTGGMPGEAFVHHGGPGGLGLVPDWSAGGAVNDDFGGDVSTAGDVNGDGYDDVLVCAERHSNGEQHEGRVDLYLGGPGGLAAVPVWSFESDLALAGLSVAAYAGDVNGDGYDDIIAGASGWGNQEGKVWVFAGAANGMPTELWTWQGGAFNALGFDVAGAGDLNGDGYDDVIMGAYLGNFCRVAFGSAAGIVNNTFLAPPTSVATSRFGASVSTAGDVNGDGYCDFLVGAPLDSTDQWEEGRAYLFAGTPAGFNPNPIWSYESNVADAELGQSVSPAGDINGDGFADILLGAPYLTDGEFYEGRAYAFYGSASGPDLTPIWVADGNLGSAIFSRSLATAGDVNGDGFSDVIAGAPAWELPETDEGKVAVWHGSADVPTYLGVFTEANQEEAEYGSAVALGDFDGDGYDDPVVASGLFDVAGVSDAGQLRVFPGGPGSPATIPLLTRSGSSASERFGESVGNGHDVNGDGFDDLLVGAPGRGGDTGAAHCFRGGPGGLAASPAWSSGGVAAGVQHGKAVAWAGDVNGDGFADALVGAPTFPGDGSDLGVAYVYLGSESGLEAAPVWSWEGSQDGALVGWSVAAVGDVNRDGFGDIAVGAPGQTSPSGGGTGVALVFLGSADGISGEMAWISDHAAGSSETGWSVAGCDANGDGNSDLVVGSPGWDSGLADRGQVAVFLSDGGGLSSTPWWTQEGGQQDGRFGTAVAAADFDLDGTDEIVASQPYVDNGQTEEGQVLIYRPPSAALWWGADGNAPLAWHGRALTTRGDINGDGFPDLVTGSPGLENPHVQEGGAHFWCGNGAGLNHPITPGLDRRARLRTGDDLAGIGLLGGTPDLAALVRMRGRSPVGRDVVALEVEVKEQGASFDGTGTVLSGFTDTGAPGALGSFVEISRLVGALSDETRYRWRARLVSDHPFAKRSPWLGDAGNNFAETDFRTLAGEVSAPEIADAVGNPLRLASRPVPFATSTTIEWELARDSGVRLAVYDVTGRRVAELANGRRRAGTHSVRWNGTDAAGHPVASGVYFAVMEADGAKASKRLVLTR